jgi:hypothetical protein
MFGSWEYSVLAHYGLRSGQKVSELRMTVFHGLGFIALYAFSAGSATSQKAHNWEHLGYPEESG